MSKEVKKYIAVFVGLLILTAMTVMVSNLKMGIAFGIVLALAIALIKGSLVACHFMHLTSEKKVIYYVLVFTAIFFMAMMFLIYAFHLDTPKGVYRV